MDRIPAEITEDIRREISAILRDVLVDDTLKEVDLYSEAREC